MHNFDILIIDDDEDDFLIVQSLLEEISNEPPHLTWAQDYAVGEKLLKENKHDICLMDYSLGEKTGIHLIRRAQEIGFKGPVILLTGMNDNNLDMIALEAGAVDYLVKDGLTAEQLARSIRYAIGRREIEIERIERLKAEAENRSKSEFLAHLSHELRTPLSAILGFTELLIRNEESHIHDNETSLTNLNIIHRNGKHLLGLLNDILDLSKIEAGKFELEVQPVKIIPLIADIFSLMHATAVDKNVSLELTALSKLPETVHTDPTRLRQILLNLIGNAIKFTYQGAVTVEVAVEQDDNTHAKLNFKIQDSGIGISQDNIDLIFKPFVQIKQSRIETRMGSGLGLTISRQLVQHLGGNIQVQSEVGQGSSFSFSVDIGDISNESWYDMALKVECPENAHDSIPQFKGCVLVVDDLRDIRTLIGHYLAKTGVEIEYAGNGVEAIHKIVSQNQIGKSFDLILMDIHMPVKDGVQATKDIRSLGHVFPIVALTAAHMKGDRELYLANGFSDNLSKPVDQMRIVDVLSRYLQETSSEADGAQNADEKTLPELLSSRVTQEETTTSPQASTALIVEDSPDALSAISGIMQLLGWNTLAAHNAQQALDLLQNEPCDIALIDINLPDMSGYALSDKIASQFSDIDLYITSGQEADSSQLNANIKGQLLKPIGIDQLKALLKEQH